MMQRTLYITFGVLALVVIAWLAWPAKKSTAPTINTASNETPTNTVVTNTAIEPTNRIIFSTADLPERDPAFEFSLSLLKTWRADYQAAAKAVTVYDPGLSGSVLQQTQVFIQTYTQERFKDDPRILTPMDTASFIAGQPARQYRYGSVQTSAPKNYPTWWSSEHAVAEVQTGIARPYTFIIFHFAPTVTSTEQRMLLDSFQLTNTAQPI